MNLNRERHRLISAIAKTERDTLFWSNNWSDEDELDACKVMVSRLEEKSITQRIALEEILKKMMR